jgi:hypothetical protein
MAQNEPMFSYISGPAGSGKTYRLKQRIIDDPKYAQLCSTTGISAVNLGTTTINSVLGYFDTDSLRGLYLKGKLTSKLADLARQYRNLAIDEVSMMPADQLTLLHRAVNEVNKYASVKQAFRLVLTGDFCQLSPVKDTYAFQSPAWPEFAANMTRLDKIWRQTNPLFLEALSLARRGDGAACRDALKACAGVTWAPLLARKFDGTTIVGKNDEVDRHNALALMDLPGPEIKVANARWGKQRGEWRQIPQEFVAKKGAYVMLLSNDTDYGEFKYANGDCGHIVDFENSDKGAPRFHVKLVRNVQTVEVGWCRRLFLQREEPTPGEFDRYTTPAFVPAWDEIKERYVMGGIKYIPLRLAYASTVHKSQGLTLDRCQVDIRGHFMQAPNMTYVSLSRVRTPQGLRIVGGPELLPMRINVHPEVIRWI